MDLAVTLPFVSYWSEVLCCKVKVTDLEILCLRLWFLEVFRSLARVNGSN